MRNIKFALLALVIATACTEYDQYFLRGTLEGAGNDFIYLSTRLDGELHRIDSCNIENGSFEFKTDRIDYPQLCYISVEGKRGNAGFFLENSEIVIKGHTDTLHKILVEGSESHYEYLAYNDMIAPYFEKNSELFESYRKAMEEGRISLADEISEAREKLLDDLTNYQYNYVKSRPASWISPTILLSISYSMDEKELREALSELDGKLSQTSAVKEMNLRLEALKKVRIGEMVPDFSQSDPNGEQIVFSELEGYEYILIDFWAAWCGPCRKENPELVEVYKSFHNNGFDIIGVSLDHNKEEWLKAISDDALVWTQVSDLKHWENEVADLFCVSSIPNNFLIDKEGRIIANSLSGEELISKLQKLLGE